MRKREGEKLFFISLNSKFRNDAHYKRHEYRNKTPFDSLTDVTLTKT